MTVNATTVKFQTNGSTAHGYLALPPGDGPLPGVVVIQEWWGLNENIKDIARRFAAEGFAAFAPDLYHGKVTEEPNEAQKLMMQLDMNRASQELVKATSYLAEQPFMNGRGIGATGFCMGGGLATTLACDSPLIKAAAPFYGGNPHPVDKVRNLQGPLLAIYAEHDGWVTPQVRGELERALQEHGKSFEMKVYPATEHAFFNDTRPEVYAPEAARDAWEKVVSLFKANL
jgi:carboxymethylenebutenolidase